MHEKNLQFLKTDGMGPTSRPYHSARPLHKREGGPQKKKTNLESEDDVPQQSEGFLQVAVDDVAGSEVVRQACGQV
jgi:hypothetical protein